MLFEEVADAEHERHHLLVHRSPQLLLTRIKLFLHITQQEVGKLSAEPYGGNVSSSHSEKILEVRLGWSRGRIQTQVKVTHSMLYPIPTERRRRTCYEHIQDATCPTQRQQI